MKKWFKRFALFVGGLALLIVIGAFVEWQIAVNAGKTRLNKVREALNAAEPGWQLDDLNSRRNANLPPDDQNVAVVTKRIIEQFPKEFSEWERSLVSDPRGELKPNHLVKPETIVELRKQLVPVQPLIVRMHEIRKFPTGGFKIDFPHPNPISFDLKDTQQLREAANKLSWNMILSTQDNDPDTAIEICRTSAHLRHAVGDEPTLISQLVRIALVAIAINSTERVLGMTEPKKGLAELQADFEMALKEQDFAKGVAGERALQDRICENMANGSMTAAAVAGAPPSGPLDSLGQAFLSRFIRDNHAQILELITAFRNSIQLQGKERSEAMKKIPMPNTRTISNVYVRLLMPAIEKVMEAHLRTEAKLATISAAIACERYRQVKGKWPEKLSDIPKDILKEIPLDPYVGEPVKYKKNDKGVVIYATGKDETDDGGVQLDIMGTKPKTDVGIQLYDPAKRRLPPEVKADDILDVPPPLEPDPEPKPIKTKN
ncbi:MAG: hypothetical protein U0798_14195 [Gemmataceae bacterium]